MEKIRWGILGCGKIAHKFATDLQRVGDAELISVASRDELRAKDFATQHSVRHVFFSYEELAACPLVDVIYVATPHGFHHEHVLLCLNHKKAVLCEKAFALNTRQVTDMIQAAKRNKVFLMEGLWTKFLPQFQVLSALIVAGEIGTLKVVEADFGFLAPEPKPQRLFDPVLGGGALLDIGIYPVFLAVTLLGRPSEVQAVMIPYATQVDEQIAITLKFQNGAVALLSASFAADTPVEATLSGSKGYIRMNSRFHNATATLEVVKRGNPPALVPVVKEEGNGFQFEARHVSECLRAGLIESPVMSFADSLLLMETLDRIRERCGIKYDADNM